MHILCYRETGVTVVMTEIGNVARIAKYTIDTTMSTVH